MNMEKIDILDVTVIEPRLKHPTIFENFDALSEGQAFIIHNDHDPKPLYYQLLGERGNIFRWEYLEEGPEFWKVKISKLDSDKIDPTIGELVASDYRKAEVFRKFGLDFCCGGKKTLQEACKAKGLDIVQIEKELKTIDSIAALPSEEYNNWDISFLADYILNTHHNYVRQAIPVITEYSQKVARVHGSRHPETIRIAELFLLASNALTSHMFKEENILFPVIKQLSLAGKREISEDAPILGLAEEAIEVMEQEHDEVGRLFEKIKILSNNYMPPADACTTFKLSYSKLKEFEEDLHKHVHLENNILFPKAIELEKMLE